MPEKVPVPLIAILAVWIILALPAVALSAAPEIFLEEEPETGGWRRGIPWERGETKASPPSSIFSGEKRIRGKHSGGELPCLDRRESPPAVPPPARDPVRGGRGRGPVGLRGPQPLGVDGRGFPAVDRGNEKSRSADRVRRQHRLQPAATSFRGVVSTRPVSPPLPRTDPRAPHGHRCAGSFHRSALFLPSHLLPGNERRFHAAGFPRP